MTPRANLSDADVIFWAFLQKRVFPYLTNTLRKIFQVVKYQNTCFSEETILKKKDNKIHPYCKN